MTPLDILARSRALWNRNRLALDSDEVLAQIVDRGALEDWRALYQLMARDGQDGARLRARVDGVIRGVPVGRPYFWLAALQSLGHAVDWSVEPRQSPGEAAI